MFCPDLIWLVFVGRYLLITTQGPAPGTTLPVCPRVSLSLSFRVKKSEIRSTFQALMLKNDSEKYSYPNH